MGPRMALSLVLVAATACAPPSDRASRSTPTLEGREIVDLTHALSATMPFWPGPDSNPFVHDTLRAHESGAPAMAAFSTPEHHGTHLDAPIHGRDGLASVDQLTPGDLFGPAVVIDVTHRVADDPDHAATVEDVTAWESRNGSVPPGAIVLLRSGWADRWSEPDRYMAVGEDGQLSFPGFGADAARLLVEERGVRALGVDTPSVDPGGARGFPVHEIANGSGRYHLENLANLDRLPEWGAYLIVAPVKIEGGSGGPVRVFAVLP